MFAFVCGGHFRALPSLGGHFRGLVSSSVLGKRDPGDQKRHVFSRDRMLMRWSNSKYPNTRIHTANTFNLYNHTRVSKSKRFKPRFQILIRPRPRENLDCPHSVNQNRGKCHSARPEIKILPMKIHFSPLVTQTTVHELKAGAVPVASLERSSGLPGCENRLVNTSTRVPANVIHRSRRRHTSNATGNSVESRRRREL